MGNDDIHFHSISDMGGMLRRKALSPVELTQAHLDRIDALGERLGAFITVMGESALARARELESSLQAGRDLGPLHGIPVAVKDIVSTRGVLTSAGSRVMADNIPEEDSTLVERLHDAGAVLLGKLNLSEFAIGGTVDHPFGTPRNPWNTEHSAGGSSSGSGVAVAGGLCAGALGSDTGGSIRGPSSFCGIVGIRPTYGRVTRHEVVPMCWSMDTVGPMTRTVGDCAIILEAIAGHDPRDATSSLEPVPDYATSLGEGVRGLRVALPREMFDYSGLDGETSDAVHKATAVLEELGASSEEVSLPMSAYSGAVFVAIADVDAAAYHSDWLREPGDDYDWNTRVRLESASLTPAGAYIKAQRARESVRKELLEALEHADVIITPTSHAPAPTLADGTGRPGGSYDVASDLGRRMYASPAALAGLPALSIPCGFSASGLPIGMQIIGRPFAEQLLFRVGHAYERATEWHTMHPEL
jgi:aspartyl-tRNA(Asn)/glutamyl-tRNA(Gln) amidotransferase subunit A